MNFRSFVLSVSSSAAFAVAVGCGGSASDTGDRSPGTKGAESSRQSPDNNSPNPSEESEFPTTPGGQTSSKKKDGAQCKESGDCESDFCVFKAGGTLGMCTQTCDGDIDCELGSKCVRLGDAPQKACVPE